MSSIYKLCMVSQVLKTTLTDESYKLYGINVTNEEIFESLYKAYSENENSLMKNASVLVRISHDYKNIYCFIQFIT